MYVGLKRAKQGIEYLVWEDKMIIFFRDTLPKTLAKKFPASMGVFFLLLQSFPRERYAIEGKEIYLA